MSGVDFPFTFYHEIDAQKLYDESIEPIEATIGQYADYWPPQKEEKMKKKIELEVPKNWSDICQNCGQN